jgi:molybdenum-dependent DNA-binding transcriptional regulator ModE
MAKLPIVSWIGNAAAVLVGGWGAVSRQAQAVGCSRQTAYDHAEKVEAAVRDATRGGSSREQLQPQLRQQAERIAALEKRLDKATEFPEQEQQRFAATATAMGLSYAQARELLEIVVKKNVPAARRSADG